MAGFEPATTRFQGEDSTRLSYTQIGAGTRSRTEIKCLQGNCNSHYTIPAWHPRQESNPHLDLRRVLFCPLNYKGIDWFLCLRHQRFRVHVGGHFTSDPYWCFLIESNYYLSFVRAVYLPLYEGSKFGVPSRLRSPLFWASTRCFH